DVPGGVLTSDELDREGLCPLAAGGRLLEGGGGPRSRLLLGVARFGLDRPSLRERTVRRRDLGGGAGARDAFDDAVAHGAGLSGRQVTSELMRHLGVLRDVQRGLGLGAGALRRFEGGRRGVERFALLRGGARQVVRGGT